jgi:hypothetical protein
MEKGMEEQEKPGQPHRWAPGFCPNPKGRPKGAKNKPVDVSKEVLLVAQQLASSGLSAKELLDQESPRITASLLAHALYDPDKKIRVKCLGICIDKVVPSLKNLNVRDEGFRRLHELTDRELVSLGMELARGKQVTGRDVSGKRLKGNGPEPALIEGSTVQGDPGENSDQGEK